MKVKSFFLAICSLFLFSCQSSHEEKKASTFSEQIEVAHKKEAFLAKQAIEFNIEIEFGGNKRLEGKMTLLTNSEKSVIELKNGQKIYQIKDKVYCSPEKTNLAGVRFDAYTWSYFFLFPYKLNDAGTIWSDYPIKTLNEKEFLTNKLTFETGTGDAPEDWYVVYADKNTNQLNTVAYIVTAGTEKAEAEKDPHAMTYKDYVELEGIPLAKSWTYYEWGPEKGLTNKIGSANLDGFKFVSLDPNFFEVPKNFKEVK